MDEKEFYVKEITKMLEKVKNIGNLEYLYTFIKLFLIKWA